MAKKIYLYNGYYYWTASTKPIPKEDLDIPKKIYDRRPHYIIKIARKILNNGGNLVDFRIQELEWWWHLYKSGTSFNKIKHTYKSMELHNCHQNCLKLWVNNPDRYQVVTGFALLDRGIWNAHTWVINTQKNILVDPLCKAKKYYGFILTREQTQSWYNNQFKK